jgi:hypothetical protein
MSASTIPTSEQQQRAKRAPCRVLGCEKRSHGNGFCTTHYARWRRHGSPTAGGTPMGAAPAFIAAAVQYVGDDCLLWPYAKSPNGYGHASINRRHVDCHVQVCETAHGPKPSARHEVAHSCGVRLCCNPAHLRWATRKANRADNILHGTRLQGERHAAAKLTEKQVLAIRAQSERPNTELAAEFGVSSGTIINILRRFTWRHLP